MHREEFDRCRCEELLKRPSAGKPPALPEFFLPGARVMVVRGSYVLEVDVAL
jgi:hypothetical protein